MAKTKNSELSRVSINLPNSIIERVKDAYIVLLNQALEQKDMLSNLPSIFAALNDIKTLTNNGNSDIKQIEE